MNDPVDDSVDDERPMSGEAPSSTDPPMSGDNVPSSAAATSERVLTRSELRAQRRGTPTPEALGAEPSGAEPSGVSAPWRRWARSHALQEVGAALVIVATAAVVATLLAQTIGAVHVSFLPTPPS